MTPKLNDWRHLAQTNMRAGGTNVEMMNGNQATHSKKSNSIVNKEKASINAQDDSPANRLVS